MVGYAWVRTEPKREGPGHANPPYKGRPEPSTRACAIVRHALVPVAPAARGFERLPGLEQALEARQDDGPALRHRFDELRAGPRHFVRDGELDHVALLLE